MNSVDKGNNFLNDAKVLVPPFDYLHLFLLLFCYAMGNVVLMLRGTELDPSMSPVLLMKVQRRSSPVLTSLSGRWLHCLTHRRGCWEEVWCLNANNAHNQPFNSLSFTVSAVVTILCNNYRYSRVSRGRWRNFEQNTETMSAGAVICRSEDGSITDRGMNCWLC